MTVITVWREPLSHVPSLCISITGQFVCNRRTVDRCFGVQLVYSQRVVLVGIVGMVGLQAKQLIDSKLLGSIPGDFHRMSYLFLDYRAA